MKNFRVKKKIRQILSTASTFKPPKSTHIEKVGGRNNRLASEAGRLRAMGYDGEALADKLLALNAELSKKPLGEDEVRAIALSISKYPPGMAPKTAEAYVSLPLDALPEPVRSYVVECARALGCDPAMVAVPLLVALASAIGNTTRIRLKDTWIEPAILWAAVVGGSGELKSPAIEHALKFVNLAEKCEREAHRKAMAAYEDAKKKYDVEFDAWKKAKSRSKPPKEPRVPKQKRYTCSDVTMEALAVLLMEQARGLLLYRDELAGWIDTFDRYASGSGDVAHWLALFGGRTLVVDRKTGETKSITVPTASVCVTGGIQPETFRRVIGKKHIENGLLARILVTSPPPRRKRWTEAVVDCRTNQAMAEVFEGLYAIRMRMDKQGEPEHNIIDFTKSGKDVWVEFYNEHADESFLLTGDEGKAAAKLEGYVARLALTIHMVRRVSTPELLEAPDAVDAKSVNAAVEFAKWFQHEARRVYAMMKESDDERDTRQHIETIQRNEGRITANELCRSTRKFEESEDAEAFLNRLEQAGLGEWKKKKMTAKGGRPTRVFILKEDVSVTQTHDETDGLGYGSAHATQPGEPLPIGDMWRSAMNYNRRWGYIHKKGA